MARIGTTDLDVLPLNLGGNVFGWTADEQASFAVLDAFAEAGGSFVDTADVYSEWGAGHRGGESEATIGRWMAARGNRAVYEIANDSVTFTGNVVVASDENVIRGETLVLNITNRRTVIRPDAGGRVRGVFVPNENNQQNSGQRSQ